MRTKTLALGKFGGKVAKKRTNAEHIYGNIPTLDDVKDLNMERAQQLVRALRVAAAFFDTCKDLSDVIEMLNEMEEEEFEELFGFEAAESAGNFASVRNAILMQTGAPNASPSPAKKQKSDDGS